MDFLELTKKRYSVRSYTSQEVEKEKLDYILECARVCTVCRKQTAVAIYSDTK